MVIGLLLWTFEPLITLLRRNEELFGSRVALHTPYTPDAPYQKTLSYEIPQILHQTTATETIPDKWIKSQQSCKDAYLDFEYKVVTIRALRAIDLRRLNFILKELATLNFTDWFSSYGRMSRLENSSLSNIPGSWISGMPTPSQSSVQMLYATLFYIILVASTLI